MGEPGVRGPSRAAADAAASSGGAAIILASAERGAGKSTAFALAAASAAARGWETGGILCPGAYRDGEKSAVLCRALFADGGPAEPWELARVKPDFVSGAAAGMRQAGQGSPRGPRPVLAADGQSFSYGKWLFSLKGLARADAACVDALPRPSADDGASADGVADGAGFPTAARERVVFIDEIGPLELAFGLGLTRTLAAVDSLATASAGAASDGAAQGNRRREASVAIVVAVRPELAGALAERWPGSRVIRAQAATMAAETLAEGLAAAIRSVFGLDDLVPD